MFETLLPLTSLSWRVLHDLMVLVLATALGAALGVVRPVRREIVPRSAHVIQAQILLAIVGAVIIIVVAESLARAFAIVGAAGLVRYRARIKDPKDAGVMLVALALGLTVGSGLYLFAAVSCLFVIGVLWLLESLEPSARSRIALKIETKSISQVQPVIERTLQQQGILFDLRGSSPSELHYEVTIPYDREVKNLSRIMRGIGESDGGALEWEIKKVETERP
jgi:uncharacterized membrane protein YhiD involved in acid resistance